MAEKRGRKKTVKASRSEKKSVSIYINDIAKLFSLGVKREANQRGLSQGNRKLLMSLCEEDGITQFDLVKRTGLSAPTVSVSLAKMESEDIVRRENNPKDLREVKVYLTEEGKKMYSFINSNCSSMEQKMLKGLSEEEQEALVRMLGKILDNLREDSELN